MSAAPKMTNVIGYYNGGPGFCQVSVSKFNVMLVLKPGEYIRDNQGRYINDPYFEVFVQKKQLAKMESDTPVPILALPEITGPIALPSASTNPVRGVMQWTRDARGVRQPALPPPPAPVPSQQPLPAAVTASATDSVRPYSIEEARRLGLVRKVREVPEDYGVNDTTGLPPGGIPKMKYSIDPSVNKPAPPLPKEALQVAKDDPNRQTRTQLVANLAQSAQLPAPEDAPTSPFANTTVSLTKMPIAESEPEPENAAEPEPEIEPILSLPEPDLEAEDQPPVRQVAPPPLRPMTPRNQFVCLACSAPHKFRSQLFKHAQQKHPDRINAIMAQYPNTQ